MGTNTPTNRNSLRVAVAGSFGFTDVGDEAMLTEDLHYLHQVLRIPREQIYLYGARPDYVSWYHRHPAENCIASERLVNEATAAKQPHTPPPKKLRKRIKATLREYRKRSRQNTCPSVLNDCHFALITGGGTINTREGSHWVLERIHLMVSEFKRHGLPVFMSGQTIGPLGASPKDDQLARDIVEMVDVLSVRDKEYSRRYLDLIEARPRELIETLDDAHCLPYEDAELPAELVDLAGRHKCAALSITDYTADKHSKRQFVAELIEQILSQKLVEQVICVSHTPRDLQHLWIIRDMIRNDLKPLVTIPDTRYWRDASFKRLISLSAVAVGGRYHFILFAGTTNTPFVGMTGNHYSYIKQDGFARQLGLSDWILTEKETWNQVTVLDRIGSVVGTDLSLADKFQRPSVSMARLGSWLREKDLIA